MFQKLTTRKNNYLTELKKSLCSFPSCVILDKQSGYFVSFKYKRRPDCTALFQSPEGFVHSEPVHSNLLFVKRFKSFCHFRNALEFPIYLICFLWLKGTSKIF